MEFKRLTSSNDDMYAKAMDLYKISFPFHEQRKNTTQIKIMENEEYHFNLIYDGDVWVGIILYWETSLFLYVEHFCILPQMRNKKYGEKTLSLLNKSSKIVILEIDPPVDDVSIHRKLFYERSGYMSNAFEHVHPPYDKNYEGHSLVVMSCPDVLSEGVYKVFDEYLKNLVMGI